MTLPLSRTFRETRSGRKPCHAGGDPVHLIHSIASAFIATLWGVFLANVIFLPMGDKLKNKHAEEHLINTLILDGITSIQAGHSPRLLKMRLAALLASREQERLDAKPGGKKSGAKAAA